MMNREDKGAGMINDLRHSQSGIALLTVMIIALIMTVLGIAAITVTGLETRMSGFVRTKEVVSTAAESCEGTAVNIIQQTLLYGGSSINSVFLDSASTPGPVPATNSVVLLSEIMGQRLPSPPAPANTFGDNWTDTPSSAPNLQLTNIPGYTVKGDIDRMYAHAKPGNQDMTEFVYRISCMATNSATGSSTTITSVYKCTMGDTCMKQIGGT
jgi:Tfp pilus assembly protein PilX